MKKNHHHIEGNILHYTDNRSVVNWITFERQIRELAVAVAPLEKRIVFIINKEHTIILAGKKIGKVITPAINHAKSVAPEGTVGTRVDCFEQGICVGFKYLSTGEIIGEICSPDLIFQPAPKTPVKIEWTEKGLENWGFSNEVFQEMFKSNSIFSSPADQVNLNFSRTKSQLKPMKLKM